MASKELPSRARHSATISFGSPKHPTSVRSRTVIAGRPTSPPRVTEKTRSQSFTASTGSEEETDGKRTRTPTLKFSMPFTKRPKNQPSASEGASSNGAGDGATPPAASAQEKTNYFDFDESSEDLYSEGPMAHVRRMRLEAKEMQPAEEDEHEDMETVGGAFVDEERSLALLKTAPSNGGRFTPSPAQDPLREMDTATPPPPTVSDLIKRDDRIAELEIQLECLRDSRWKPPQTQVVIDRILLGQSYSLDWFKSLKEKRDLLDAAVETHDGNCIMTILLFMRKTLEQNHLMAILRRCPVAAKHYFSFLKQLNATSELSTLYKLFGDYESAGHLMLEQCEKEKNVTKRAKKLRDCHSYFHLHPELKAEAPYVDEYATLTDKQRVIDDQDSHSVTLKRVGTVSFQPLTTTLLYCCRYHSSEPESYTASPEGLRKKFNISEKQYFQVVLKGLCVRKDWAGVEKLVEYKRVFGGKKKRSPIGFERVVKTLASERDPKKPRDRLRQELDDVITMYLVEIDDLEDRFRTATEVEIFQVAIDTLREMKDRARLQTYINYIPVDMHKQFRPKIETILANKQIKWKT